MPLIYNTTPIHPPPSKAVDHQQSDSLQSSMKKPDAEDLTERPLSNNALTRAELIERIKAGENPTWSRTKNINGLQLDKIPPKESNESEKPHSALHTGVFSSENARIHPPSPVNPNFATRYPILDGPLPALAPPQLPWTGDTPFRSRARTHSVSSLSNYILKPPTSPLVHSTNPDQESTSSPIDISSGRRLSLVPSSTLSYTSPSPVYSPSYPRQPTHASRKSLTDNWYDSTAITPTRQQSRRLSCGFGLAGDLPFGSFVGSYEESILSGRMSTTPSKPLEFIAQIGVLGFGKCKTSLKCPTHVAVPFPAYFYSVGDYDSPSPYVGQIDLESALSENKCSKGFTDGGYRIPQKGQLQIVIKNPNKTAVKLFLVKYDLTDMEPGTKTFIRQKSYSADFVPETRQVPATPRTVKKQQDREREALRYMIHLHICSPSKGKYFLHRNIRVVFANRVPDGKEKLRNETHQPEPKYSPWKPGRSSVPASVSNDFDSSAPKGRKRSTSLMYSFGSTKQAPPPIPPLPLQFAASTNMDIDKSNVDCGYDKLSSSVYSNSSGRSDSEGLLTRRLKSRDSASPVDGDMDVEMTG